MNNNNNNNNNDNNNNPDNNIHNNPDVNTTTTISDKVSDNNGWLGLKDDASGKIFYFKDGEYVWKIPSK